MRKVTPPSSFGVSMSGTKFVPDMTQDHMPKADKPDVVMPDYVWEIDYEPYDPYDREPE